MQKKIFDFCGSLILTYEKTNDGLTTPICNEGMNQFIHSPAIWCKVRWKLEEKSVVHCQYIFYIEGKKGFSKKHFEASFWQIAKHATFEKVASLLVEMN